MLGARGIAFFAVVYIRVYEEALVVRLAGRFTCAKCGKGYHDKFEPPATSGVCDACGGTEFTRRADDEAETVRSRLKVYGEQTAPLVAYYSRQGKLKAVDGMADIDSVTRQIAGVLDPLPARQTSSA
jgi:adenylate kinase